ncbi:Hint domain-containing protein [Tabrizicola sp.]|uniref:Hint domain-containing protein n=1 Tax=Tabrizicola sp. TaxID=2005166 RepID=UPI0026155341|nr:Hint domain-containing protein [Tabrizicola sp.]MDM7932786.1 Hint domain-containing protein [Tabrizicola sp.]
MATYRLGFLGFGQISVQALSGQTGTLTSADAVMGLGPAGTRLRMKKAPADLTSLVIEEEDTAETGVLSGEPRRTVGTGSRFGTPGERVDLAWRATLRTNTVPASEAEVLGLRVGGHVVGLVTSAALDPGVQYSVLRSAPLDRTVPLRRFAAIEMARQDTATPDQRPWEPIFCLTFGTMIDTPDGPRLVEQLAPGDLVSTLDNGSQPLRWIGDRHVAPAELNKHEALRPIEISAGMIGNHRPLIVAPRHRILLNDWRAQVYFGEDNVLVPARALVNSSTIRQIQPEHGVTYVHLLFDRHEVIVSEGALSESFHPGGGGLGKLDPKHREEIASLFPGGALERRRSAFPIVRMAEARALQLPG